MQTYQIFFKDLVTLSDIHATYRYLKNLNEIIFNPDCFMGLQLGGDVAGDEIAIKEASTFITAVVHYTRRSHGCNSGNNSNTETIDTGHTQMALTPTYSLHFRRYRS
jgi:hypothetical protein